MATIKDVAEHAQVSRATVSRVLNNTGQVTESTRERVAAAIEQLDYRPNPVAQSLASNTSNIIGLMVSSFRGGFFGDLMAQVQHVVDTAGKVMIVTQGKHSAECERAALEHLMNMRCDGLLLHVRYMSDEELIKLAEKMPPFVLLDRYIEALADHCITFDHVAAGERAVQVLMDQGHTQIACLAGKLFKDNARQRFQGYANQLQKKNLPVDMELVTEGDYDRDSGYRGMKQILATGKPVTAVYACSEEMAVGCMDALREVDMKVPDDISLISYDSVDLCTFLTPHVSALHFPITEMASVAGTLLMNQMHMDGFHKPEVQHFEGELRLRNSVKNIA